MIERIVAVADAVAFPMPEASFMLVSLAMMGFSLLFPQFIQ